MKFCIINNLYFPFSRGGAEKIIETQVQELKNAGNEVFIITTRPYFQSVKNNSLKVYYLPSFYFNLAQIPIFIRLFWHFYDALDLVTAWRIKTILSQEKPDEVITHNLKGVSFLIPRILKKLKIKHTHTLHDIQLIHPSGLMFFQQEEKINNLSAKLYQFLTRSLFNSPDKIISPSKWLLDIHKNKDFFKSANCEVKINSAKTVSKKRKVKNNKLVISNYLFVGQIEKHKGIELLLKVFSRLEDSQNKLKIVGDGSQLKRLQKEYGQNQNIQFTGRLDKSGVEREMRNSDCLIVPSLCYENSPTVIYESQAIGLPVIASKLGGIPELVDQEFLFTPDEKGLREMFLKLKKL